MTFKSMQLSELALGGESGLVDGPFGSNLPATAYVASGVPVIRGSNLSKGEVRFRSDEFVYVSEETAEKLARSTCEADDIIFTKKGTLGQVGIVPPGSFGRYLLSSNQMRLRVDRRIANADFVYYALANTDAIERVIRESEHTGVPKINLAYIRQFRILVPRRPEQDAIATLLRSMDGRIALLRDTNATLEGIAQALFKSWFVDFDPVRAKAEGSAPQGLSADTAALFPDGFDESELGLVPKGWAIRPIGDVVSCVGGGTPDTKEPKYWSPPEYSWTTPKDLSGLVAPVLLDTERKLSASGLAKVSSGLLPAGTLLMSSRAPIGYLAIAQIQLAVNQGYIAMPPGGELTPLYLLFWCQRNMDVIKNRANGSTFMEISKKAFRPIPALVPPAKILGAFGDVAEPLLARLVENERQAVTLAALRDTLLPRLISGQLRIPEAEAMLEDSA